MEYYNFRQSQREYFIKYRKRNKEKIKEIGARSRAKLRERKRKQWNEWYSKNKDKYNAKRLQARRKDRLKFLLQSQKAYRAIRIDNNFRWNNTHISEKTNKILNDLLKEVESSDLIGALDADYWKQIKPRIESCIILAEKWKKEFDVMYNRTE